MNKTELVAAIAAKADLTKKDAEKALAAGIEAVIKALKKGDKV
ncbi:MAG: HU family DNA-binding protein, partial [Clostridia bacterium]|nr:HU family DNA-binding protein [Clostridia bacterium]